MDMMPHLEAAGPALFLLALGAGVLAFFAAALCAVRSVQAWRFGPMAGAALLTILTVASVDRKVPLPPLWAGSALAVVSGVALLRDARGWDRLAPLILMLFGAAAALVS